MKITKNLIIPLPLESADYRNVDSALKRIGLSIGWLVSLACTAVVDPDIEKINDRLQMALMDQLALLQDHRPFTEIELTQKTYLEMVESVKPVVLFALPESSRQYWLDVMPADRWTRDTVAIELNWEPLDESQIHHRTPTPSVVSV